MTDEYAMKATREEVDIATLYRLPFRQQFRDGYSLNTHYERVAMKALRSGTGANYRVSLLATNTDGERYDLFINQGRGNDIGPDGLVAKLDREGLTLNEAIEKYSHGLIKQNDIAFYELEFFQERHRR